MAVLKKGSSGPAVTALQQALKAAGFDPGPIDGDFGDGTDTAVRAFQTSKDLVSDGLAGQATQAALGLPAEPKPRTAQAGAFVADKVTVDMVAKMFPDTPRSNIATHLPAVLSELNSQMLGDKAMILMALGTIRAETAGFVPIPEGRSKFNTSPGGHPFDLYDDRTDLGNRGTPDGASFKGRGFVQLTGRSNYEKFSPRLGAGVDIVTRPDDACDSTIAARLLALFLKDKEDRIRDALANDDLALARKLVNGGHLGLDAFEDAFDIGDDVIPEG